MPAPQALLDRKRVAGESHHRPWRCTLERAIYCPLHGDCTCSKTPDRETLRDPVADASRFRHRDCPVPPLSVTALDVIERVNRRAGRPVSAVEIDVEEATG